MNKDNFIKQANEIFRSGDFSGLVFFTEQYLSDQELSFSAYFFRGLAQSKSNLLNEAIESFNLALEIEPDNANVISERGVTYHLLGKNKMALIDLDRAQELEPSNPYRYSSRAYLREILKDYKGAQSDYEKAIELDAEDSVAHNNLGMLLEKMGYVKDAQKLYEVADKIGIDIQSVPPVSTQEPQQADKPPTEYFRKSDVIKKIFSDKDMRKEFWQFIKQIFKSSK